MRAVEGYRYEWPYSHLLRTIHVIKHFFCLLFFLTSWLACLMSCSSVQAEEMTAYQDWRVQKTVISIEAYTAPNANSSFGLYCSGDQCLFYLHDALLCQPGSLSPVLMSSIQSAVSISLQCTQVGGKLFQILQPFTAVLNTLKTGGIVSFAVPLQAGTFGISSFSLAGSDEAIKQTLFEAAKSKENKEWPIPQAAPKPIIPGSKKLQEIKI